MKIKIPNFKTLFLVIGTSISTTILTFLLLSLIYSISESYEFYEISQIPIGLFLSALIWLIIAFLGGLLVSKFITKTFRSKFRKYSFILSAFILIGIVIYVLIQFSKINVHGSFIKGTKVLTPSGTQAIENLKVGDQIISYDDKVNKYVVSTVQKNRARETVDYHLINNMLGVTAEHPIAIRKADRSLVWKRVRELSLGEKMIGYDNNDIEISNLEKMNAVVPLDVYNPQTSFPHNYFVIIGNTLVLVHNKH